MDNIPHVEPMNGGQIFRVDDLMKVISAKDATISSQAAEIEVLKAQILSRGIEHRTDCEQFEPKRNDTDCGDCETDGHYLCVGCRKIAPFEGMSICDNAEKYYPKDYQIKLLTDEIKSKQLEHEFKDSEIKDLKAELDRWKEIAERHHLTLLLSKL